MRTPGSCSDVAQPSVIFQCTMNGAVYRSRRNPKPGMIAVKAQGSGRISRNSTSSRSPAFAPLTNTGPVNGWTGPTSNFAKSATVVAALNCPSSASRAWRTTSSLSATSKAGGTSGCHRLCPLWGSSLSCFLRSISMLFTVFSLRSRIFIFLVQLGKAKSRGVQEWKSKLNVWTVDSFLPTE